MVDCDQRLEFQPISSSRNQPRGPLVVPRRVGIILIVVKGVVGCPYLCLFSWIVLLSIAFSLQDEYLGVMNKSVGDRCGHCSAVKDIPPLSKRQIGYDNRRFQLSTNLQVLNWIFVQILWCCGLPRYYCVIGLWLLLGRRRDQWECLFFRDLCG